MNELDPDAKALFDVARDALGPPAGTEARIFAQLGAAAGVSAGALAATTSAAAKPATLLAKLSGGVLQLLPTAHALPIAVVAFSGTVAGVWGYEHTQPTAHVATTAVATPSPRLAHPQRSLLTTSAAPVVEESAAPPVLSAAAQLAPVVVAPGLVAPAVPAPLSALPSSAPRDAQAQAEMQLIAEMQAAWRAGDSAQLSIAIAEHRAHFPHGMLNEEREALSAMLACRLSPSQVSELRARFAERYPRSAYEARVSAACSSTAKEGP